MTTDGHDAYPRAIRRLRGRVQHRCSRYLNNRIEQGHRAIKQRYYPMRGFGSFAAAARFCLAHDELRDYLRPHATTGEHLSLSAQRRIFQERWEALVSDLAAATCPGDAKSGPVPHPRSDS